MPSPNKFKELSCKLAPYEPHFVLTCGAGIILIIISIFLNESVLKTTLHGLAFLMFSWGGGFLGIVSWFGEEKATLGNMFTSKGGTSWISALFIDVWFIVSALIFISILLGTH